MSHLKASYQKYLLNFKQPAKTSRDVLKTKDTFFIYIQYISDDFTAIGECSPLWGLSIDDKDTYEQVLSNLCTDINNYENWLTDKLDAYPSIKCGLEMAILNLKSQKEEIYFPSSFTNSKSEIQINGLIWMGDFTFMKQQIIYKIKNGFKCVKLKIGGIDFENELELLRLIRNEFSVSEIEIRLDANGGFTSLEALEKLKRLSEYQIHSIEQPIKQNQWEDMSRLCEKSPIDIALDEELIGVLRIGEKLDLINSIKPQYLIFKPSLIGGFKATDEWIDLCEKTKTQWWITSALESNIGLNAIAQYTATKGNDLPQGLGTGGLFTNNKKSPLILKGDQLSFS